MGRYTVKQNNQLTTIYLCLSGSGSLCFSIPVPLTVCVGSDSIYFITSLSLSIRIYHLSSQVLCTIPSVRKKLSNACDDVDLVLSFGDWGVLYHNDYSWLHSNRICSTCQGAVCGSNRIVQSITKRLHLLASFTISSKKKKKGGSSVFNFIEGLVSLTTSASTKNLSLKKPNLYRIDN